MERSSITTLTGFELTRGDYQLVFPEMLHLERLEVEAINKKSFLTALPPGQQNEYSFSIIVYGGIGSNDSK